MELPPEKTSVEDYLALDRAAEGRLELLNGVVVAMAGASPRHNRIVTNLVALLHGSLQSGPRQTFAQDQRVKVEPTESYVYPDIVVVCDEPDFDTSSRPASLRNPSAIVEVLSESTLDHDLGAKLSHYRRIPSVRQVLFVHVEQRAVTHVARREAGTWTLFDEGPTGAVELVGVTLSLDAIYAGTDSLPA